MIHFFWCLAVASATSSATFFTTKVIHPVYLDIHKVTHEVELINGDNVEIVLQHIKTKVTRTFY